MGLGYGWGCCTANQLDAVRKSGSAWEGGQGGGSWVRGAEGRNGAVVVPYAAWMHGRRGSYKTCGLKPPTNHTTPTGAGCFPNYSHTFIMQLAAAQV